MDLVCRSMMALIRHDSQGRYGHFNPLLQLMHPLTPEDRWVQLDFRIRYEHLFFHHEDVFRDLGKKLPWAWEIASWIQDAQKRDGHAATKEDCPIRPIDMVCQVLDHGACLLVEPDHLRQHVRRWCEHPISARNEWCFRRANHMRDRTDDEAKRWLIDNHFMVCEDEAREYYCFTEKFVLLCWQDAMTKLD